MLPCTWSHDLSRESLLVGCTPCYIPTCADLDSGALVTLVPLFQAEIAPPASRGFLVAQHGEARLQQLCNA